MPNFSGIFFQILCASQKVQTLLALKVLQDGIDFNRFSLPRILRRWVGMILGKLFMRLATGWCTVSPPAAKVAAPDTEAVLP